MNLSYRKALATDLQNLKQLGIKAWSPYQQQLSAENWALLSQSISSDKTYEGHLNNSKGFVCIDDIGTIIGMAFLVPNGNPNDIFLKEWSYIRFVSVDPDFAGQGIGRRLTAMCIDYAKETGEKTIALHTSEMMDNARHLYESMGFSILREIEPRLGKRYWLYTLELSN